MNDLQKEYTINQISKYLSEAEELDNKAHRNTWFIYGSVVLFVVCETIKGNTSLSSTENLIATIMQSAGVSFGIDSLRKMIGNMSKKSGLENMANNLFYQIDYDALDDKNENGNKGRGL